MAIHPEYAEAILQGRKHVEFRKRPLADDVRTVVMYATSPVKRVVGEFNVQRNLYMTPGELWAAAGAVGAIDADAYSSYFARAEMAVGLVVDTPKRYPREVPLAALTPAPAVPQSFCYLSDRQWAQIRHVGQADGPVLLARLASSITAAISAAMHLRIVAEVIHLPVTRPLSDDVRTAAEG